MNNIYNLNYYSAYLEIFITSVAVLVTYYRCNSGYLNYSEELAGQKV